MATYNTAFGALPDYKDMIGQQPGQYMQQQPQQQTQTSPQTTFSQLQQQGMARPAPPPAPMGQQYQQYGGSQQAQQARQSMLAQLQQQLAQPTRFDSDVFNQIRQAQAANLQQEFGAQKQLMDEEMARRGIYASSIAAGRFGDLLGQQARALSSLDAELLQQAAQTQAQDRLAAMQAGVDFSQLAGSQDLAEFEANRVAQAQQFQEALQSAQFGQGQFEAGGAQALAAAQAAGQFGLSGRELDLRAQQIQQEAQLQGRSLDLQEARDLAQQEQFQAAQQLQREQFYGTLSQEESQFARSLDEQRDARLQNLGISEAQLDLEARKLMQGDRSLDLQQAKDLAEIRFRATALQQEAALTGRTLDLQEARQLAEQQLGEAKLMEETAARLQQFGIASRQLDIEVTRVQNQAAQFQQQITLDSAIRNAEVNLRAQQIQNEYELGGRRIDLDTARLEAETEIEYAKLGISREELEMRKRQLDLDDFFRRQQLAQQGSQFDRELEFNKWARQRGFDLEENRDRLNLLRFAYEAGFTDEQIRDLLGLDPKPRDGTTTTTTTTGTPTVYIPPPGSGITDPMINVPVTTQIEELLATGGGGTGGYADPTYTDGIVDDDDLLSRLYNQLY
jgi:hypothetical protein